MKKCKEARGQQAEMLWRKWPRAEDWPDVLTVAEAAAYKRVGYHTIFRACTTDREGRARLAHQRFGTAYRISRAALDNFGKVENRELAGVAGRAMAGLLVMLFALGLMFAVAVRGEAPPPPPIMMVTAGDSMGPNSPAGEPVLIERIPFEQLRPGMVVAWRDIWHGNAIVGHRIMRRGGWWQKGWITRGDANAHDDMGLLTPDNYKGVVVRLCDGVVFYPTIFNR